MESPVEEYRISKDINRTLPELGLFKQDIKSGQNKLYNVLKAYACYDNKLGYVQGMNYLAAMLLINVEDEVLAFWCLFYILFRKNWRKVYDDNTPKLMNFLKIVEERLGRNDPMLYRYLKK